MAYQMERHHGSYNIQRRSTTVKYIVVHYTGSGTSAAGSALANCKYFAGGNRNASANYFIDDATICEYADPKTYYTWHCGDGHGKYGISNSNSIGIEVCQNGNVPYTEAEISRLAWLVQKLMADFNVPASRVVRHYDASRKACPYYYTPSGAGGNAAWNTLHARITSGSTTEEDIVTEQDIQKIALAVWSYHNEKVNPGVDAYGILTEMPLRVWNYKNPDVNGDNDAYKVLNDMPFRVWNYHNDNTNPGVDAYGLLTEAYKQSATITAMSAALEQLSKSVGADPDEIAKAVSDAVAKKLESIDLSVTVSDE